MTHLLQRHRLRRLSVQGREMLARHGSTWLVSKTIRLSTVSLCTSRVLVLALACLKAGVWCCNLGKAASAAALSTPAAGCAAHAHPHPIFPSAILSFCAA